jgi:hypothetical protein
VTEDPAATTAMRALSNALLSMLEQGATRVSCTEPGCRSELICPPPHVDNLAASWRCLEHRNTPSTTDPKETTQ